MSRSISTGDLQREVSGLNARTQLEAFEAAKTLSPKVTPAFDLAVIAILRRGRRPFNRAAAAYLLQFVPTRAAVAALESVVDDVSESVRVRAEAAEALALNHRIKSHTVLLRNLLDASKDVRFWCAYALGEMSEPRAVSALEQLVDTDMRVVRGFHSVSQEALDAIRNIRQGEKKGRRKVGCAFCLPY